MYLMMFVALATLVLCTSVEFSRKVKEKLVIYVDMQNGTLDSNCWKKGLDLPCGSLELAIAGARKHNSTIHVLPFGSICSSFSRNPAQQFFLSTLVLP